MRRDGPPNLVPVDAIVRPPERDIHGRPAAQLDGWRVGVVRRLEQQNFVARPDEGRERGEQTLGRT